MSQSRTLKSVRNIIWAIIQKIVMIIFPFAVRTVMIAKLGEEYTGLSSLFTSVLSMLSLAELGFSNAMVYCMYEPIHEKNQDTICALLNLYKKIYTVMGVIILGIGILVLPFLSCFIKGNIPSGINVYVLYLIYLLNTVVSYFMFAYKSSLMTAYQRNDIISRIMVVTQMMLYSAQIGVLILFKSFYLYALLIPLLTVITNLSYEFVSRKLYPEIICKGSVSKELKDKIKKRVIGIMLYKFSSTTRTSFDSVLVSMSLGLVLLARYQNYFLILTSVAGVLTVINTSVTASVGDSIISKSVEDNYSDFKKFVFMYMWIAGWFTVCFLCLVQPFMTLWMGKDMLLPILIVLIMTVYFYVQTMGDIVFLYRTAAGLWWEDRIRPVVEAVANILLNLLLVQLLGLFGIILATVITLLFINFLWGASILFKHYFKREMREYIGLQAINALVTCFAAAITWGLCSLIPVTGIYGIMSQLVICVVIPNIVFWCVYRKTSLYHLSLPFVKNAANIITKKFKRR